MRSIVRRDTGASYQRLYAGSRVGLGDRDAYTPGPGAPDPRAREKPRMKVDIAWDADDEDCEDERWSDTWPTKAEHAVDLEIGCLGSPSPCRTPTMAIPLSDHRDGHCRGGAKRSAASQRYRHPRRWGRTSSDKGYHSDQIMYFELAAVGLRSYVAEQDCDRPRLGAGDQRADPGVSQSAAGFVARAAGA